MPIHDLLVFGLVYALAAASPGPGVAAIVARGLARGGKDAMFFVLGFTVGDILWILLVTLGLAAAAKSNNAIFVAVRYAGAIYLLYTAYLMWTSKPEVLTTAGAPPAATRLAALLGGTAFTLGNPKSMVFFLAIVPTIVPLETIGVYGAAQIFATILLLNPLVLGAYALAAARAQRLLRDPTAIRRVNRGTAIVVALVAVAVAID